MTACEGCKTLAENVLNAIMDEDGEYGCSVLATEFEVECIALGGRPEESFADYECSAAAEVMESICEEEGTDWIKNNVPEVAELICKDIGLCS